MVQDQNYKVDASKLSNQAQFLTGQRNSIREIVQC